MDVVGAGGRRVVGSFKPLFFWRLWWSPTVPLGKHLQNNGGLEFCFGLMDFIGNQAVQCTVLGLGVRFCSRDRIAVSWLSLLPRGFSKATAFAGRSCNDRCSGAQYVWFGCLAIQYGVGVWFGFMDCGAP